MRITPISPRIATIVRREDRSRRPGLGRYDMIERIPEGNIFTRKVGL